MKEMLEVNTMNTDKSKYLKKNIYKIALRT